VSRNFAEGFLRLDPTSPLDQVQSVRVRLDACAHKVKAGHQIRLLIAGGSHPRYARNEGTGAVPGTEASCGRARTLSTTTPARCLAWSCRHRPSQGIDS
jgi:predicted acyl esterase